MRTRILLASFLVASVGAPAASQPNASLPLGAFRQIALDGGGVVTVRHASVRRLTLREGSLEISRVALAGDRLLIERCPRRCPRDYRLTVEIAAPALDGLAVSNGGLLRVDGAFPDQAEIATSVSNGGSLDLRALAAARIAASVREGGRILVRPGREMTASVSNGGLITYWGSAAVRSSVRRGGAVVRGAAADWERPLEMPFHPPPPTPVIPPLPPVPR